MKNLSRNESRVLRLLVENSRLSISEIAKKLDISRNTVSCILKRLNDDYIERYTVDLKNNGDLYYIVKTDSIDNIDPGDIVEYYELMNGKYIVVLKNLTRINYESIDMAGARHRSGAITGISVYCDYCGSVITGESHTYEHKNRIYYFCCSTCKSQFLKERI
ncbi:TRASH domain-containing protein [Picrophilus oshimae]|uniref:Transcriptional regulator, AsnC family n=1 Tax=Picrophilus torridus (strain ATCC 700027 / DSM 9790 / JCM 10055 / NBRC 100828 / KAW 2/3) TaxID=1122961 RepID=A0A8G2L8H0_PICTO|nr:TRASH domain-containing protein [Picrophilus oshimae]SMD31440.1 transcriptional regulator, AsnC family [Picrophilus oshimae DSM 9789]